MKKQRCPWLNVKNTIYVKYHDQEWGRPVRRSKKLFELLCLEGMQAGLSWETVLNKRENYRKLFFAFDPNKIAKMTDKQLEKRLLDPGIIRNRLKVYALRKNAQAYLDLSKKQTFTHFIWSYVNGAQIVNMPEKMSDYHSTSTISDQMSKDLKQLGFTFVGSKICYAFMQAAGLVDDHSKDCWRKKY